MQTTAFLPPEHAQIAHLAAQILRETGLELAAARAAAAAQLGLGRRAALPPLHAVLAEAQTQLRLFEPQAAAQLLGLRRLALRWMADLAAFAPLLRGNVWLGVANLHSTIYLDLYADSSKDVEIFLINQGVDYDTPDSGEREDCPQLRCYDAAEHIHRAVTIALQVHDAAARQGALRKVLEAGSSLSLYADSAALLAIMST